MADDSRDGGFDPASYWIDGLLRRAVTALALEAEEQLRLWRQPLPLPECMANDFEEAWPVVRGTAELCAALSQGNRS